MSLICMQMGLFSLGAVQALAAALSPLCSWLLPHQSFYPPVGQIPVHAVLSFGASLAVVVVWLVFRSSSWAWALQDLLGISLIIMVLRQFRLPDIKVCNLLHADMDRLCRHRGFWQQLPRTSDMLQVQCLQRVQLDMCSEHHPVQVPQ